MESMEFDIKRCSHIVWPEILLRGIEFWLTATKMNNKEPPVFKLPAILASSDNQTWLATRKSQKLQKDSLYAEWLSSSAPAPDSAKSTPSDSRVPCLAQHTVTAPAQDVPIKMEQDDCKQQPADKKSSSSISSSGSSYHDIWLRSNSCTSAVHEYSNFRFMYSTDNNHENDNIWLADGAKKAGQQKWSPKRQRLEAPASLSFWSTSSVAPVSSKSSSKTSDHASSCQDTMMVEDVKDKEDSTLSAWLNVKKSVPNYDEAANAIMDTNEESKKSADLLSSWLNVKTTTEASTDQMSAVTQKEKDIMGWIESVQKGDATAPHDYDAWLIKTGDSLEKGGEARKDSLDAIRSGFKTLQVDDCEDKPSSPSALAPSSSQVTLTGWLSTAAGTTQASAVEQQAGEKRRAVGDRLLLADQGKSVSSETGDSCSWVLCTESAASSRASSGSQASIIDI
eukprot:TRINITY_DN3536_c0_g1_i7.p1 TRINITY_DN3536_c0_g1~~TRINITY_DN3536_c0_g1_i7.p1  ORF type:complete len:451 (-),score=126.04 TRINITY_DN3536_c0_g1_i7:234-1586(-)